MRATVVVADADEELREHLQRELQAEGMSVVCTGSGAQALHLVELFPPDLVILGVALEDSSGFDIAERMGYVTDVPVLLVGVMASHEERLPDADTGVDDYVTRPFRVTEVVVRAMRLLRSRPAAGPRDAVHGGGERALRLGEVLLDLESHRVTVRGRDIPLPPSQATILRVLIEHAPRVVSPELLAARSQPWTDGDYAELGDAIMGLRVALEVDPLDPEHIIHVPGYGYKIVPASEGRDNDGNLPEDADREGPGIASN